MKADIEIESGNAVEIKKSIAPDLDSDDKVKYELAAEEERIDASIQASKLGHLRGATDTFFRLSMLAEKIASR